MASSLCWLAVFFIFCQSRVEANWATSPPISVKLKAQWNRSPLLLEASEYIAEVDERLFWQFVWQFRSLHQSSRTDKDQYESIMSAAKAMLATPSDRLLSISLSLHTHSPAVQMFQQVSSEVYESLGGACDDVFININNRYVCNIEELNKELENINNDNNNNASDIQSFDHCYPFVSSLPTAILYGEIGTSRFSRFIELLWPRMEAGQLRLCVRHFVLPRVRDQLVLSGYGVQLAIKNTEYKAMDDTKVNEGDGSKSVDEVDLIHEVGGFNFTRLKERYTALGSQLDDFKKHLLDKKKDLPQLKAWEVSDLGIQTVQSVLESEFPFNALQEISHNLPVNAKTLSRLPVSKDLRTEIAYNQGVLQQVGVGPGDSILLLNGLILQDDDMNVFSLLEYLKRESRLLSGLEGLGIPSKYFLQMVSLSVHPQHSTFAVDMRNDSVLFINNVEEDKRYYRWPSSVTEFLRPAFPGTLRQIRKNAFTIVFVLNPLTSEGIEMLQYISLFMEHLTPFRLGVLFVDGGCGLDDDSNTIENSKELISGFLLVSKEKGEVSALAWAISLLEEYDEESDLKIRESLRKHFPDLTVPDQLIDEEYIKLSCDFFMSRGFSELPQVTVNGVILELEDEDLQNAIVTEVQHQTSEIQQLVYRRRITDSTNIYNYFMSKPNVLQRLNKHVANLESLKVDLSGVWSGGDLPLTLLSKSQLSAAVVSQMTYLTSKEGEFTMKPVSLWVVVDLSTSSGRQMMLNVLKFMETKDTVRVCIIDNPSSSSLSLIHKLSVSIIQSQRPSVSIHSLNTLFTLEDGRSLENEVELVSLLKDIEKFKMASFEKKMSELVSSSVFEYQREFLKRVLQLEPGTSAILSNGRLIGPLGPKESFLFDDLEALYNFEISSHARIVSNAIDSVDLILPDPDSDTTEYRSDLVMRLASLLRSQTKSRRLELNGFHKKHSVLSVPPLSSGPVIHCLLILDPLSTSSQKLSPLLGKLKDLLPLNITVLFNPVTKLSALPLKDFYRLVVDTSLSFDSSGWISTDSTSAVFRSLPPSPLFTLNMDVPHSWMVEAIYSPYDLDNIHLASVDNGVEAEFVLEYILVEGQCFDAHMDSPIPGLQYVMGTDTDPELYDTIVMANLGYFQLKGKPGAWKLRLREGRSSEVYQISSYYQSRVGSGGNVSSIPVTVSSFTGNHLIVRVTKKPGMEKASLLLSETENQEATPTGSAPKQNGGIIDSISKFFVTDDTPSSTGYNDTVPTSDTINIFSIASGHLYERFLRIMMLSVLKHTKNPVKFWFLKNYLSPQFKDFIPRMAERYGFEYELVQYKWPRWLHGQTEKQRLIWAYKILFLDVLFPLNIKKIIFVDADQVVRTDMKELLEEPLDGAPYGYTPFCDSRTDMDGFRFWKSGYWKNHLGRRRYHISALYVIDLQQFRLLAAGDRLRGQYQMLSQDPNSLSNLDQDLPNSMIHNVPIKSLPQDWLWCETWCSMDTKSTAKTIDLCNNPMTKEPKLTSAVRIIDEWVDYDNEIKQLQKETMTETSLPTTSPSSSHTSSHQEL